MPRLPRRLVPYIAAGGVAGAGALLVLAGALRATALAPDPETVAQLEGVQRQPIITTQVGLLNLEGSRVRVDAGAPGRPVFLGVGRAADVEAYLGKVSRIDITGHDTEGRLLAESATGETSLPDPAGVDVWAASVREQDSASLVWPETPGQWRLVVATDGSADGPRSIAVRWTRDTRETIAPALIAVGVLALVGGGVTLAMLQTRARLAREQAAVAAEQGWAGPDAGVPAEGLPGDSTRRARGGRGGSGRGGPGLGGPGLGGPGLGGAGRGGSGRGGITWSGPQGKGGGSRGLTPPEGFPQPGQPGQPAQQGPPGPSGYPGDPGHPQDTGSPRRSGRRSARNQPGGTQQFGSRQAGSRSTR